jgi:dihydrodipicolinate reductase
MHAGLAAELGIPCVAGATGLAEADHQALIRAAGRIPVVYATNDSVGMTLLADLVESAPRTSWRGVRHRDRGDAPPAQDRLPIGLGPGARSASRRCAAAT